MRKPKVNSRTFAELATKLSELIIAYRANQPLGDLITAADELLNTNEPEVLIHVDYNLTETHTDQGPTLSPEDF